MQFHTFLFVIKDNRALADLFRLRVNLTVCELQWRIFDRIRGLHDARSDDPRATVQLSPVFLHMRLLQVGVLIIKFSVCFPPSGADFKDSPKDSEQTLVPASRHPPPLLSLLPPPSSLHTHKHHTTPPRHPTTCHFLQTSEQQCRTRLRTSGQPSWLNARDATVGVPAVAGIDSSEHGTDT